MHTSRNVVRGALIVVRREEQHDQRSTRESQRSAVP
jgi:hypothetical protein